MTTSDTNNPKAVAQFLAETKEADPELYAQAMREVEEQEQAETSKATLGDDLRSLADSANLSILDGYAKQADAQDVEIERLRCFIARTQIYLDSVFRSCDHGEPISARNVAAGVRKLLKDNPT